MRMVTILLALCALAGCGADGEPIRPSLTTNVGIGDSGAKVHTQASASRGRWTMGVGLGL